MSSMPRARSTAVVSRPTGPPPVTSTRSSGVAPDRFTVWIAIAVGSVSAAARVDERVGDAQQLRGGHDLVAAERAARERRGSRAARGAGTPTAGRAGRRGTRRTRVSGSARRARRSPSRSRRCRRAAIVPAHSWPSTLSGRRVLLEHEVQVGAADPAVRHLHQRFVGAERRERRARCTSISPSPTYTAAGMRSETVRSYACRRCVADRAASARNDEAAGTGRRLRRTTSATSDHANVLRFVTLAARGHVELDVLALFERLVAVTLNVRVVDEDVLLALRAR